MNDPSPTVLSRFFRFSRLATLLMIAVVLGVAASGCGSGGGTETEGGGEAAESESLPATVTLTSEQRENVTVGTTVVERRAVGEPLSLPGRVAAMPDQVAYVTSLVAGRVEAVYATTGDRVRAGQPLVEVASPRLGGLTADLRRTRTDLNLQQRLTDRGVGVPQQLANAKTAYEAARQNLRSIGLSPNRIDSLGAGNQSPGRLPLTAPLSGIVLERTATRGGPVTSGETLFRIVDPTPILVEADAYEEDLSRLREGLPVEVRAASDSLVLSGTIDQIVPEVEATRRTATVRIRLPNTDRSLTPGMFATVRVEGLGARRPAVPARSVQRANGESFVFVAENDSTYRRESISVSPDAASAAYVPVPEALLGTRVVTDGALQLTSLLTGIEAEDD